MMMKFMIISIIIILVVLVLSVLAISKGYQYKHTIDSLEDNPHLRADSEREQTDERDSN